MRKPSPISISSPRETSTSRPSASAASASSIARGVVVDDDRRLGAGQPPQDRGDVILARAARAFARGRTRGSSSRGATSSDALERGGRRAARGRGSCARSRRSRSARGGAPAAAPRAAPSRSARGEVAGVAAGADLLARPRRARSRAASTASGSSLAARELVDRRQIAQLHARHDTRLPRPRPLLHCRGEASAILVAVGLVVLAAIGAAVARAIQYDGAAKPGVQRARDRRRRQVAGEIEAALAAWARRPVTIRAGGRSYHVPRGWLVSVDAASDRGARARRRLAGRARRAAARATSRRSSRVRGGRRRRARRDRPRGAAAPSRQR